VGAGNKGGESETIIGKWFAAHPGVREKVTFLPKSALIWALQAKKAFPHAGLNRRSTTHYAVCKPTTSTCISPHWPDSETPYDETLGHTKAA
jgi:aryl-alcohol dehydrogenase-like predicted oxidoreductase